MEFLRLKTTDFQRRVDTGRMEIVSGDITQAGAHIVTRHPKTGRFRMVRVAGPDVNTYEDTKTPGMAAGALQKHVADGQTTVVAGDVTKIGSYVKIRHTRSHRAVIVRITSAN